MSQYIIVFAFLILVFTMMGAALFFSKYKKRPSGCCEGGKCAGEERDKECCGRHEHSDIQV